MKPLTESDPRVVGRYRLQARLGGGGMGQVYLGRSPGGRPVAVKVVRPELAADPQFRQRFAAEVEAARRVGGFHTTPVVDADPDGDPPWLVTAYVPGPSLATVLAEQGALPEDTLRVLAAGLAEALESIHRAGLVHRDLKPSNILLADDGPRVIDFGIARALEGTALTRTGAVVGTPGFMAPEQVTGSGEITSAADVFALGAVLCHAAGVAPFGDGPTHALLYRVVHQEPDLDGVPASLRPLIAACLAKDPTERPTAAAVLSRLTEGADDATAWLPPPVQDMVTQATPPTRPYTVASQESSDLSEIRLRGRKRSLASLCLASLALLAITGSLLAWGIAELTGLSNEMSTGWAIVLTTVSGPFAALSLVMAYAGVLSIVNRFEFVLNQAEIRVYCGKLRTIPWEDIEEIQVREQRRVGSDSQKQTWGVALLLRPDKRSRPGFGWPELDENGAKTGWQILAQAEHLHAGRAEVERAVARFAGPRYTSPGR
ncbi:serine/threonine-protein kinase [Thermomonospora catenispora]|uniref:serine/threonine-protein kinase n=1 Tax=Thermomonospora catenispora TaxID=2493090 RepID=UPI00111E336A|nr:serine/threonine-protein kinase [Thermomonospora catenispora]TNY38644.1 serine/threonine protein kinase [Thermomonospora catenispora]